MVFKYILSYKFILILSIAVIAGSFVLPSFAFGAVCLAEQGTDKPAFAPAGAMAGEAGNVNIAQMPQDFGEADAVVESFEMLRRRCVLPLND